MLHRPNKTHNTEDYYALKNLVKGAKNRKRSLRTEKVQKFQRNERVNFLREKALNLKRTKKAKPKPHVWKRSETSKICC